MEKKDVKIGDVVCLNSEKLLDLPDATIMTVTDKCDEVENVNCSWFSNGLVMSEWFPAEALTKVPILQ
ncbi:MAG: hypothetical protein VB025_14600 [Sphaerochaeta sp.]|nr:hypothetical protein [Sphaerochaeta sp.]